VGPSREVTADQKNILNTENFILSYYLMSEFDKPDAKADSSKLNGGHRTNAPESKMTVGRILIIIAPLPLLLGVASVSQKRIVPKSRNVQIFN
jgi:hypothetical protein